MSSCEWPAPATPSRSPGLFSWWGGGDETRTETTPATLPPRPSAGSELTAQDDESDRASGRERREEGAGDEPGAALQPPVGLQLREQGLCHILFKALQNRLKFYWPEQGR